MTIQENVSLKPKTTMHIGGTARYYTELETKSDVEEAFAFAQEKNIPMIVLGGGSNTLFADGTIEALVVRVKADNVSIDRNIVTIEAGKHTAMLVSELAEKDLDLSALAGVPGMIGGAIFGNAGQGPKGIWTDAFVNSVTAFIDGEWKTFSKEECGFEYRESGFKKMKSPIIWEATLTVPSRPAEEIEKAVEKCMEYRFKAQPYNQTAGSCFKACKKGIPAWERIDAAGLRGHQIGGVQISEKHANFLMNTGEGTFDDVIALTSKIREDVPEIAGIEMRLYGEDGKLISS